MREPDGSIKAAQKINITSIPLNLTGSISKVDPSDFYRFNLVRRSKCNLFLTGSQKDIEGALLIRQGKEINLFESVHKRKRELSKILDSGIYYVRIFSQNSTKISQYRLNISAKGVPSDPDNIQISPYSVYNVNNDKLITNTPITITKNRELKLRPGDAAAITNDLLQVTATGRNPDEVVYTITDFPKRGRLEYDGGSTSSQRFTQADINSGRLQYVSAPFNIAELSENKGDYAVAVSGSNVIWATNVESRPYNSYTNLSEVVLYNSLTKQTIQLTNNQYPDIPVSVSGSNVLWHGFDGTDYEVFFYNGTTGQTTQLTNNSFNDFAVEISGSNIIWYTQIDNSTVRAFFYDGTSRRITQLSNPAGANSRFDFNTVIGASESHVVWQGFDGTDFEVFLYDIAANRNIQITNNSTNDLAIGISGSNIVWNSFDGEDNEVFFYNSTTSKTLQLTNNQVDDSAVGISGTNILWNSSRNNRAEVFFYNGAADITTQLTNNNIQDTAIGISGSNAIWQSDDTTFFYNNDTQVTTKLSEISSSRITKISNFKVIASGDDIFAFSGVRLIDLSDLASTEITDRFSFTTADGLGRTIEGEFQIMATPI